MFLESLQGRLFRIFCLLLVVENNISNGENPNKLTDEDRLHQELFVKRHYNPDSRPVFNANEAVAVHMSIVPIEISQVDDLNEILKMHIWLQLEWMDFRLAWNSSDYGGLKRVVVRQSQIWTPDIVLMNSAQRWKPLTEVKTVVYSDGSCDWFPPLITESSCPIDISWFPFDEQYCTLEFESWSYVSTELNLTLKKKPVIKRHYRENSEWDLMGTTENVTMIKYSSFDPESSHVEFTHHLRRRTLFYWFNLVIPCSLLSALSAVAFVLPAHSGERIGLEISTLLALSVFQLLVADRVPPTSDSVPIMAKYFVSIMAMNSVSIILMVIISNLYHRSSSMHPMPNWVKTCICQRLGRLLGLRNKGTKKVSDLTNDKDYDHETDRRGEIMTLQDVKTSTKEDKAMNQEDEQEPEDDWQFAAIVIDRLCCYICFAYITLVSLVFYICALAVQGQ